MDKIFQLYDQFLRFFPDTWHTAVSLGLLAVMALLVYRHLKTGILGIILLVIFVPTSVPILKQIAATLIAFVQQLFNRAG